MIVYGNVYSRAHWNVYHPLAMHSMHAYLHECVRDNIAFIILISLQARQMNRHHQTIERVFVRVRA